MKNSKIREIINTIAVSTRVVLVGNIETQVHMVLDKKDPSDLNKAYILVRTRDILSDDKRWKISYRSKKGSIQLIEHTELNLKGSYLLIEL